MYSVSSFRSHPSPPAARFPAARAYVSAKLREALESSQSCFQRQYAVNCLLLVSFNQEQEDQPQNHKMVALEWIL